MRRTDLGIVVDNFACGGGASTGIALAIGRSVDVAINHDPMAIAMHLANHPDTLHLCESVWDVDPRKVAAGRVVALGWFSPDCTHFSKAKGGKPVKKSIRGLAWVVVRWAATVRPRVIILENVEEFKTWGPLIAQRDQDTGRLLKKVPYCGNGGRVLYEVVVSEPGEVVPPELQILVPDPKRKGHTFKSFVNALRYQGYHVDWRELRACDYGAPTIRKRLFLVARCDGKPIVWPEPTHGDPNSAAVKSGRLKPWRTAAEVIDWTLPCPSIFDTSEKIKADYGLKTIRPLADNTIKRIARGTQKFVLQNPEPFILKVNHSGSGGSFRGQTIHEPFQTITSKNGWGIVAPYLTQYHSYESDGARGQTLDRPLLTIDTNPRYALTSAFITKYYGKGGSCRLDEPLHTITTKGRNALITSHLVKMKGTNIGQPVTDPVQTITAHGLHFGEVRTILTRITGKQDLGHWPEVREMLNKYCGCSLADDEILLLEIGGALYFISDIGMRMLEPRELYAAQGFPATYIIDRDYTGKRFSKAMQVRMVGNSVPPQLAEALTRANLPELCGVEQSVWSLVGRS